MLRAFLESTRMSIEYRKQKRKDKKTHGNNTNQSEQRKILQEAI